MGIELLTSEGKSDINKDNFVESMIKLEEILEPGNPVMFQNYRRNSSRIGKSSTKFLFFSGGNLSRQGVFNLQKGKRNYSFVDISENLKSYQVVNNKGKEELSSFSLNIPKCWTTKQYNERTFSPARPIVLNSFHSAGTEEIVVGGILAEKYPDAMNALMFARDAVYFELHPFYSMQNYLVTERGDQCVNGKNERQRSNQTHRMACLKACINLIGEAEKEIGIYRDNFSAKQVGWFSGGAENFRDNGFPVDDKDYIIERTRKAANQGRIVAFVKTCSGNYGGTYILPINDELDELIELAFSEEIVKKSYPHGLVD